MHTAAAAELRILFPFAETKAAIIAESIQPLPVMELIILSPLYIQKAVFPSVTISILPVIATTAPVFNEKFPANSTALARFFSVTLSSTFASTPIVFPLPVISVFISDIFPLITENLTSFISLTAVSVRIFDAPTPTVTINKGDFAFLVGSSGSGKSTLIKLILKEEEPTSGHIIINGKDTTFLKPKRVPYLRRSMGVVFQDFRLLPDKTVYENVAFAMYIVRATPKHIRRQVPMVLAMVGLSDKANVYPNELSGGEQQRVALARALVNNPSMLIADEPTGNLDPDTAWDIMRLLNEINLRGTTLVVATHAKDIVDKMNKRVIRIENGNIISDKKGGYDSEA